MVTKLRKNGTTLEEIRLSNSAFKTFVIKTTTVKDEARVFDITRSVGIENPQNKNGTQEFLTYTTRERLLELRRHNETQKDKVQYEVL